LSTVTAVDPVTVEVTRNGLIACADDMNAALVRSAYTPVIYEGRDCAVALLDENGDTLGQCTGVPLFLGNLNACVEIARDRYGRDWFRPGDLVIMNDSYLQGSHLNDVSVLSPVFLETELIGFAATRAHWLDIGSMDPGGSMASTEIYQEGLRLGPIRVMANYEFLEGWLDVLMLNTRFPRGLQGDLNAQIAACRTGERRLMELVSRMGLDMFRRVRDELYRQADELDRAVIESLPDGRYTAEGAMDNDGVSDEPVPVRVTVDIKGDTMVVDLVGTSGPVKGPMNIGSVQTVSAVRVGYKMLINPHLPVCGGSFRTLSVVIPESCLFNAQEPVACQWYFSATGLLIDLIIRALAPIMPERVAAAHYGDSMVIAFDGQDAWRSGERFHSLEPTAGGWGGFAGGDGESALINLVNGPFRNIPVEVLESKYPLEVERWELRKDSGGAGKYRGGCGIVKTYRCLVPARLYLWFERSKTPGWGLFGGESGAPPTVIVDRPAGKWSGLKANGLSIDPGTLVTIETGGGGGYGPPRERARDSVCADVLDGFISTESASEKYGVEAV
jgi:N-methylhydantoinase B